MVSLLQGFGIQGVQGLLEHAAHHAVAAYRRPKPMGLQGYLAHKKTPPPWIPQEA